MKRNFRKIFPWTLLVFGISILILWNLSLAGQWVNPKLIVGDPMIARLQQGRMQLTPMEKEEIKKYGYTALELMTYVDINADPGQDNEAFFQSTKLDPMGIIQISENLERIKYFYKNPLALLTYDAIKPGEMKHKEMGMIIYPSGSKGLGWLNFNYLNSEKNQKERYEWSWNNKLRRFRRGVAQNRQDKVYGTDFTLDDDIIREPWEEDHRILGEDAFEGHECFVIEGKHRLKSNYYLSKRVVWAEKNDFLDLHEEQFDRKGRLFKIFDKKWEQIKPWNYWVIKEWNIMDLSSKSRTIQRSHDWIFDQGYEEKDFSLKLLTAEKLWRQPKDSLPFMEKASELPPEPKVRREFWNKIGVKPVMVK